ncbi:hypothetical protein [Paludisphaera soli]|uniref:hypothetical protein n=1 Tax=Paludisphaera soli TaxID=2712865 RepID=UPI0013ECD275|nr:hypothetical protein [Paludisphaera soli]
MRSVMVWVALGSLPMAYTGTYHRLSRRGMQEAREFGLPGFLYVPFREAADSEDLTRQQLLAILYAPLNWMDRAFFDAPGPVVCVMWRLSG